uniref:Uncharacterized protein n=1 Tax=Avena sativa TaxID=4498 RepID=A0ACD5Z8U8_AVESA
MDDTTNWRPVQGCNPPYGVDPNAPSPAAAGGADWRAQLRHDDRTRIVNNILETLKVNFAESHLGALNELQNIAVRFEHRMFTTATSQPDYLRKISWKMGQLEMGLHGHANPQLFPIQNNHGQGMWF